MKRILFIFIISISVIPGAYSDDGSWSRSFSLSGGSIYAAEDDGFITLEKELLIFNGEYTEAVFLFRNTSSGDITLDCGFPVVHRIDVLEREGFFEIPVGKYGGAEVPGIRFFETAPHPELDNDEPLFAAAEVITDNDNNRLREFIGKEGASGIGIEFAVFQDGEAVAVDDVLLERELYPEYAGLTFHFRHKLFFPAGKTTVVTVKYSQDLLSGNDGGLAADVFRWRYIIGTGGTWKGPIGELFFIKPLAWEGEPAGMKRVSGRLPGGVDLYHASDYEPERGQEFELSFRPVGLMEEWGFSDTFSERKRDWSERILTFSAMETPAQDFVTDIRASSFIGDTVDVFTDSAVFESAPFSALSAFDGLPETSWCEGAAGDGVGEFLEFRLTEPASGLIIRNGFKRFTIDDWVFETGAFERFVYDPDEGLKDYFSMNGRVKQLEILNSDGEIVNTLKLDDRRDPQAFFGLNLLPGRYRLAVGSVYQGSVWQDTCLAEVAFIQIPAGSAAERLFYDSFYAEALGCRKF